MSFLQAGTQISSFQVTLEVQWSDKKILGLSSLKMSRTSSEHTISCGAPLDTEHQPGWWAVVIVLELGED